MYFVLCRPAWSGMYCLRPVQHARYRLAVPRCRLAAWARLSFCRISTVESGSPNSRTTCRWSWCMTAGASQHINWKARCASLFDCSSCSRRFMAPHVSSSGTESHRCLPSEFTSTVCVCVRVRVRVCMYIYFSDMDIQ